ncbi:hypothetical protein QT231_23270 [Halomonas sp. SpR1]|nr:hypothetical protein [Halomonas sp. SpR1]MDQ7735629.1 hypothetical protein [Halomonas sp. SpR1]
MKLLIIKTLPYQSAGISPDAGRANSIGLFSDDSDERSYAIFANYSDIT